MLSFKVLCIVSCLAVIATAMPNDDVPAIPVLGGVSKLSGDELKSAEATLQTSLTKLAAGDGPHYTIVKVHSATHQVVSGFLNKYKVDLQDQDKNVKHCDVSIWSQSWLENGIEVTFECEGAEKLVRKHSA